MRVEDDTLRLSDGRRLSYRCFGPADAPAVFFMHGTPGSRYALTEEDALAGLELRFVLADRPGYGGSDPRPGRSLSDWAEDVRELADHLGLDRWVSMGASGGAPHALAVAHALPDRVSHCLLIACPSPAPSAAEREGLARANRLGLTLGRWAPWLMDWLMGMAAAGFHKDPERWVDSAIAELPAVDRALCEQPAFRAAVLREIAVAYQQGADGHRADARVAMSPYPWSFDPAEVRVPTHIFQGTEDVLVTMRMAESLTQRIPGATLHRVAGAGHLLTEHPEVVAAFGRALEN